MDNKDSNHTRIYFINPNGIAMSNQCEQHQKLYDTMNAHKFDYFGCPEINLDTTQQAVQQTLKKSTKAAFSQSSIQFGSTPISAKHFYRPGGTMWSYFKFTTADAKIVTVITVYKPCTASSTTGTTTYHQQLDLQQLETNTT
eukprot:11566891-Ditylum_brightwellii.AAC.1